MVAFSMVFMIKYYVQPLYRHSLSQQQYQHSSLHNPQHHQIAPPVSLPLRAFNYNIVIASMSYSFLFKYIIIGDQSVGKSCLLTQFIDRKFKCETDPTIGVEFGSKTFKLKEKAIKLQIWDTAGQEVYKSITRSYYRGTIGAVLVYDISSRNSFNNVLKWIEETRTYATNDRICIMLVGNKADLQHSRQVSTQDGQALADQHGMLFVEASAKTAYNVDLIFEMLSQNILEKVEKGVLNPRDQSGGIKIGVGQALPLMPNKRMCC